MNKSMKENIILEYCHTAYYAHVKNIDGPIIIMWLWLAKCKGCSLATFLKAEKLMRKLPELPFKENPVLTCTQTCFCWTAM